jgi:tetratricopeptide (TPR) repeat protein/O-antigen ligase
VIAGSAVERLDHLGRIALLALLLWAPLAIGASWGWPLAVLQLLALLGVLVWVLRMVAEGRLEWRRSAVDLPLALLVAVVGLQLVLGNRPLALWALAPSPSAVDVPARLPTTVLTLGTVAPAHTARALLVLLTYASAYFLVVNVIRTREQLERLVATLVSFGGLLAFLSVLDYLTGHAWLLSWRDRPLGGRLAGTFPNPDHFAAWLAMVICLGLGWLVARQSSGEGRRGPSLRSREEREEAIRQYLPFVALVVMAVALVFTLSRGAVLSLLLTFVFLLVLLGRLGRIRWSLAVIGALVVVALGYATWIGLEPFLARVRHTEYASRWVLALTTFPILRSFPFFGVGFGAYGDIYAHYQPAILQPGKIDVRMAHNDLLQLLVELGIVGAVPVLLMVWRVSKDLLGAHLLGKTSCPVGGGEEEGARRHDPFSVGIAVGAVGAVLALLVHSAFDFAAHIPANGVLAAACLGIATVALHTRFTSGGARLLTAARAYSLGSTRVGSVVLVTIVTVLLLVLVPWILRPPLVTARLNEATRPAVDRPTALNWAEAALAVDPRNERTREVRARLRLEAALETWNLGVTLDGPVLSSWEERRATSLPLVRGAIEDYRTALAATPVDPYLHESLARAYWTLALLDAEHVSGHLTDAVVSFRRAVESAPESPFAYRSLAVFAVPQGGKFTAMGLWAASNAVERDPTMLVELVDRFVRLGLSASQWIAAVPDSVIDRLELGALLEKHGLPLEGAQAFQKAAEIAPAKDAVVPRWLLARVLQRQGRAREALAELANALTQDPANPELHLERARALAALGDASAIDAYRLAVLNAEVRARQVADGVRPFGPLPPRARALVSEATGGQRIAPGRYRRALAQYLTDRKLWDEARQQWEMVLHETPMDAEANFGYGVALDGLGARDQAVEAFRRAVTLDANSVQFRLRLAQRLWETEQYYQAMNEWRTVLGQAPGNLEARLALARAYVKSGHRNDAVLEYQRLIQIAPDQPEVRRELARLGQGASEPGAKARARD